MNTVKPQIKSLLKNKRVVLIGVGNTIRGDDGVGPYVASSIISAMAKNPHRGITVIDAGQAPENYIGEIIKLNPEIVLIVDALDFEAEPGHIEIFEAGSVKETVFSTHGMSLSLFSHQIHESTGARILLLGVKPYSVQIKDGLTDAVKNRADELIRLLSKEIKNA